MHGTQSIKEGIPTTYSAKPTHLIAYSTTAYLADSNGDVQYDNTQRYLYEFVEDNDDLIVFQTDALWPTRRPTDFSRPEQRLYQRF